MSHFWVLMVFHWVLFLSVICIWYLCVIVCCLLHNFSAMMLFLVTFISIALYTIQRLSKQLYRQEKKWFSAANKIQFTVKQLYKDNNKRFWQPKCINMHAFHPDIAWYLTWYLSHFPPLFSVYYCRIFNLMSPKNKTKTLVYCFLCCSVTLFLL